MINMAHIVGSIVNTWKGFWINSTIREPGNDVSEYWAWQFGNWKYIVMRRQMCRALIHLVRWQRTSCGKQSERQVFKEHTVAATMTDGDLRWPVQEIAAMRREEKRIHFHEDQEGKEDYQTQSNEFELVPGWALLKTPDKTEQIKVVPRSRWSPPQTGVEESHGLGLTTQMKTALWAEQPDWNEQKLQNLIYFPIPRILFSVVWFAKLCNDFSFCYEPLPACWLFVYTQAAGWQ